MIHQLAAVHGITNRVIVNLLEGVFEATHLSNRGLVLAEVELSRVGETVDLPGAGAPSGESGAGPPPMSLRLLSGDRRSVVIVRLPEPSWPC